MNFAENYTVTFQDEIQSAHWKQREISTYSVSTVLISYRESLLSKVIVSDCRDHDKKSVAAFTAVLRDDQQDTANSNKSEFGRMVPAANLKTDSCSVPSANCKTATVLQ